jgi:hypothetical protein
MCTSSRVLRNPHATPMPPGLERWQPSVPISSLALPASFGLHRMFCHPFWAGLRKPEARCLSSKTTKPGTIPKSKGAGAHRGVEFRHTQAAQDVPLVTDGP